MTKNFCRYFRSLCTKDLPGCPRTSCEEISPRIRKHVVTWHLRPKKECHCVVSNVQFSTSRVQGQLGQGLQSTHRRQGSKLSTMRPKRHDSKSQSVHICRSHRIPNCLIVDPPTHTHPTPWPSLRPLHRGVRPGHKVNLQRLAYLPVNPLTIKSTAKLIYDGRIYVR